MNKEKQLKKDILIIKEVLIALLISIHDYGHFMSDKTAYDLADTITKIGKVDPDCECDCHKVIDRDRFGGSHKCC